MNLGLRKTSVNLVFEAFVEHDLLLVLGHVNSSACSSDISVSWTGCGCARALFLMLPTNCRCMRYYCPHNDSQSESQSRAQSGVLRHLKGHNILGISFLPRAT